MTPEEKKEFYNNTASSIFKPKIRCSICKTRLHGKKYYNIKVDVAGTEQIIGKLCYNCAQKRPKVDAVIKENI